MAPHDHPRRRLVISALLLLAGCASLKGASPPPRFMHLQHREMYSMNEADLEHLQFFVSTRVVAHDLDEPGPEGVVLVPAGTPGLAIASGPRWIRVQFKKGGPGVVFLADPSARGDSQYGLATETDTGGYQLLARTPDRILRVGARRLRIVEGFDAHLLVDSETLRKLVAGRRHVEGERLPKP